jgi:hypothetical protein
LASNAAAPTATSPLGSVRMISLANGTNVDVLGAAAYSFET